MYKRQILTRADDSAELALLHDVKKVVKTTNNIVQIIDSFNDDEFSESFGNMCDLIAINVKNIVYSCLLYTSSGGDILVSSTGEVTVNNAASAEEAVHATRADNATNVTNVPVATASALGGVKSGGDISVGSDGTVSASGKALRITNGGVALYYKFMSFDIGGDKGMIRFGIVSPLLGYGEFMINWGWQGTTEEKHCNPYCVFSTGSQMYNRVRCV